MLFALASFLGAFPAVQETAKLKVLISVDMEGVAGLVHDDQVNPQGPDYEMGRRLMTAEANAAIRGADAAGATEILLVDAHWNQRNLLVDQILDTARAPSGQVRRLPVTLITGRPKPMGMMEGIDASVDAVVCIGYHPRAGTENGVLDHTWSSARIADVRVNGSSFGESELNAALAGEFGVPVVFLSGDRAACEQARERLGAIETVAVKEGIGRSAARSMLPAQAARAIEEGVKRALERRKETRPFRVEGPVRLTVQFHSAEAAFEAAQMPGARLTAPTEVTAETKTFLEAWRFFWSF
jgi:D-amino peptidase